MIRRIKGKRIGGQTRRPHEESREREQLRRVEKETRVEEKRTNERRVGNKITLAR